jgi:transposase
MAESAGLSEKSVGRLWHKHGLKPHLSRTFKVSNAPKFAETLEAIIGLYLNPPEHAIVLCADEKSQIQALDRTQPIKNGRCGTMPRDYKSNGTATLFAAMNTSRWRRYQHVRRSAPPPGVVEVSPRDRPSHTGRQRNPPNRGQLRHPQASQGAKWFARRARFHIYFTPTRTSWLNLVERFFRDLTQNRLRRGVFRDVEELITAIGEYIDHHNDNPKPFVWTAKASDILEKVERARKALDIG